MTLDVVCTPWDHEAEVAGVRGMLDPDRASDSESLDWSAAVAGWLVATPDRRPVVGVVSGPLWLAATVRREDPELDPQDALDEASDFVAGRVRRLCQLGVAEVVVLERAGESVSDPGAAAEAHTAIVRLGRHFGVSVILVALDDAVPAGDLGYEHWVSPNRSAGDLVLVSAASLRDGTARSLDGAARRGHGVPPRRRAAGSRPRGRRRRHALGAGELTCSRSGSTWVARSRTAT